MLGEVRRIGLDVFSAGGLTISGGKAMILKVFDVHQDSCNVIQTDNMGTLPLSAASTGRSTFEHGRDFTSQATGGKSGTTPRPDSGRRLLAPTPCTYGQKRGHSTFLLVVWVTLR